MLERVWVPRCHSLVARHVNCAAAGAPVRASRAPSSAATLTPLLAVGVVLVPVVMVNLLEVGVEYRAYPDEAEQSRGLPGHRWGRTVGHPALHERSFVSRNRDGGCYTGLLRRSFPRSTWRSNLSASRLLGS